MVEQLTRLKLEFEREPDGGYVVTSPDIPELVTEGDTWEEAWANIRDALSTIMELYREEGKPLYVISDEEARRITTEGVLSDTDYDLQRTNE